MDKLDFEKFASQVLNKKVTLHYQTNGGKWYECTYTTDFTDLDTESVYGVAFDGAIDFDFKTGKSSDSFFKTFITQSINKYFTKIGTFIDGELRPLTKVEALSKLRSENRVAKHQFYTTLYGIGIFIFLTSDKDVNTLKNSMSDYLKSKNIEYSNEISEAGWVLRFVIKDEVETHNYLLNNFEI